MWFRILVLGSLIVALLALGFHRLQRRVAPPAAAPVRSADALVRVEQGPAVRGRHAVLLGARAPEPAREAAKESVDELAPLDAPVRSPRPLDAVRVLLEDEEGDPAAGIHATLTLLPGDLANRAFWPVLATADATPRAFAQEPAVRAVSNEHGELQFGGVPWSRRVRIDVPPQAGFAHACLFQTTSHPRRGTIALVRGGEPLVLRAQGVPAELDAAWLVVRRASGRIGWSVPLHSLRAHWAGALDGEGRAIVPTVPAGDLAADLVVPGVGMWRGLPIVREKGGTALVTPGPTETATVGGVLRGPDGEGIGGARLALAVTSFLQHTPRRSWLRWARSDDEGRFLLEDVPVGRVAELYVAAEGFVAPRLILEGAPLRPGDVLQAPLQLIPACSLVGRVVDAAGQGRAGVRVRPRSGDTDMMLWDPPATWTDARGRYRIDGLPPGTVRLTASEVDLPGRVEVQALAEAGRLVPAPRATLEATEAKGRVEIVVVDRAGRPVSGASVGFRTKHAEHSGTVYTGPTDPQGRYAIEGVASGAVRIEVWAYKRGAVSEAHAVEPADAESASASVRIVLPPVPDPPVEVPRARSRILLRGRLVDGAGKPIVGVDVQTGDHDPLAPGDAVRTDAAGRFEIPVASRHDQTLRSGERVLHPRLSPGAEPLDIVFDASRLQVVEGRILDREGRQATAGQVHVTIDASGRNPEAHAAGGFFRMELAGRTTGRMQVHAAHSLREASGRELPGGCGPAAFEPGGAVVLTPRSPGAESASPAGRAGTSLEGYVVDVEGRPLEGARVVVGASGADERQASSSSDGGFRVEGLPNGPLALKVWGPPGTAWTERPRMVDPAAGPVGITLSRTPSEQLFTARVRALDLDDFPVPDAPLLLWGRDLAHPLSGRTDADGRCAFELVPRDEVSVGFRPGWKAPGYTSGDHAWHAEVSPGDNDLVLRLPRRRRDVATEHDVEIRLVDVVGEVLPDTRPSVRLLGVGAEEDTEYRSDPFAFSRGATRTVLRAVRTGTYRLLVTLPGIDSPYLPVPEREIQVPGPGIDVELVRAAELHGVVEGNDVEGYQVRLWFDDGASWVGRTISSSGAFAFYVDPAAAATVTVHHPGRAAYARRADVAAGDAPVRLSLDRLGLEIKGRLMGLKAMPERYDLRLMGDHYGTKLKLDDDFGFHARGVPPGTYRLSFSNHDFDAPYEQSRATGEAQAGDTDVVLELGR